MLEHQTNRHISIWTL